MKMEGLTFPETLERLAKAANIEYNPKQKAESHEKQDFTESLINACRDYAGFCYHALRGDAGSEAMKYLRERRFNDETMKRFGVGYSPEGSASFLASKESAGKSLQLYEQAGIILRGTSGDAYDRFHGRVIFPIFSPVGRIIGFGGRVLASTSGSQHAKYVNSPETPLYHKSQVLYGLFQAKDAIRKQDYAILVEGYADVLALSQAGFQNVVAASGTSLTTEQLAMLRRYSKQIVLLFDADTAGKNAALRGIELAIAADFDVSTVVLPTGQDPDSYIRDNGREAFTEQLERKTSFIEAKARILKESGAFETPESSARAVRSIVETIAKVPDAIKREFFVRKIAEKFKLMESMLLSELQKIIGTERRRENQIAEREEARHRAAQPVEDFQLHEAAQEEPSAAERMLVRSFIEDTETAYKAAVEMDFDFSLIRHEIVRSIIMRSIGAFEVKGTNPTVSDLLDAFAEDKATSEYIVSCAAEVITISSEWIDAEATSDELRERVRLTTHQSAAILTKEGIEKELTTVKQQLAEDIDEDQLHSLLNESIILGKKLEEARMIQARYHV
jgi:DNA primase